MTQVTFPETGCNCPYLPASSLCIECRDRLQEADVSTEVLP